MAIRATIFNQEKKTDDNVLLIYIIKRYLWSSINSLKNAFTKYVRVLCFASIAKEQTKQTVTLCISTSF